MGEGAREALPAVREALHDSDEEVQLFAALTLVNNHSYEPGTIPILLRTLRRNDATLRQVACLSLALVPCEGTDKEKVLAALSNTAASDAEEQVRQAAASALHILSPESTNKSSQE
jgi:HEAT repeat protein